MQQRPSLGHEDKERRLEKPFGSKPHRLRRPHNDYEEPNDSHEPHTLYRRTGKPKPKRFKQGGLALFLFFPVTRMRTSSALDPSSLQSRTRARERAACASCASVSLHPSAPPQSSSHTSKENRGRLSKRSPFLCSIDSVRQLSREGSSGLFSAPITYQLMKGTRCIDEIWVCATYLFTSPLPISLG